ncbi:MAG: hypothetical protein ICV87_11525 [Gemmatimonadetes bacterium]|nr:hypothetical protein [Gemmatimonadota bacterium]
MDRLPEVQVGVLISRTAAADVDELRGFVDLVTRDAAAVLEEATGVRWNFHSVTPDQLSDDAPRRPGEFLQEASLRMIEGPYDWVLVVTDAGVSSRANRVVPGLASRVARVVVVSTRKLLAAPRGRPRRSLQGEHVRWNASTLLVHLAGRLMGLRSLGGSDDVMAPFAFDEARGSVPPFRVPPQRLHARALALREREHRGRNIFSHLAFHAESAARHPGLIAGTLLRSRAPLLPLRLPSLATAAVAPAFVLMFTAEIWDTGLNLRPEAAVGFAFAMVLASTLYLIIFQALFFPHRERRVVTEHLAVVNVTLFLTILLAIMGLFVMLASLILVVVLLVVPPGLASTWPTLDPGAVTLVDRVRVAAFIASIGVLTGALAGGLDSRILIRHLALFPEEP